MNTKFKIIKLVIRNCNNYYSDIDNNNKNLEFFSNNSKKSKTYVTFFMFGIFTLNPVCLFKIFDIF